MIRFETISGSLYEVDNENNQVRRLIGIKDPTPRQGEDGEWRGFKSCTPIKVGSGVVFVWEFVGVMAKTTLTSIVKNILTIKD